MFILSLATHPSPLAQIAERAAPWPAHAEDVEMLDEGGYPVRFKHDLMGKLFLGRVGRSVNNDGFS
jgi:hypothetical protein